MIKKIRICKVNGCRKPSYKNSTLCTACKSRRFRHNNPKNKHSYNYEKTINGFLVRAYRNMKSRITGIQKKKHYLYVGKELLIKEDFYVWSRSNPDFLRLYKEWVSCGYDQRLTPSVNRINSQIGYTLNNMEWITNSQNCALSSVTRKLKDKERQMIYNIMEIGKT